MILAKFYGISWKHTFINIFFFLGSYIHTVAQYDSSSSSSSKKSSQIQGTGFMAGVVIGAIAGAFVLSALVSWHRSWK